MNKILLSALLIFFLAAGCGEKPIQNADNCSTKQQLTLYKYYFQKFKIISADKRRKWAARKNAAIELAKNRQATDWLVLYLERYNAKYLVNKKIDSRERVLQKFDASVIHVILNNLHDNPSPTILLSIVNLLHDKTSGRWSSNTRIYFIFEKLEDGQFPPVQDAAREYLKNQIGADCKFSKKKWRKAINDKFFP